MTKKIIVFDFFGVICSEIAPLWLRKYFNCDSATEIKTTFVGQADVGKVSEQELFMILGELANISAARVEEEWYSLVKIDLSVVDYIRELKVKQRVALLTNSPSLFVRKILNQNNLESLFEQIIVSSEAGIAKPDPAIFRLMLSKLGVQPENAIMVDDNSGNVTSALSIGMNAILFLSTQELRRDLSASISLNN